MWNAAFSERSNLRVVPWHPCARSNAVLQVAHDLYTIVQALVEASYVDGAHVTTENHQLQKRIRTELAEGLRVQEVTWTEWRKGFFVSATQLAA